MLDVKVEVSGLLKDCNLLEDGRYFIHIVPDQEAHKIDEVLRLAERLKLEPEDQLPAPPEEDFETDRYFKYLDRIQVRTGLSSIDPCSLAFESDRPPTLKGCLSKYQSNEEIPKMSLEHRVRVLGKLEKMKGGNCVLMFHLVDEVPYFPEEGDEDFTGSVDYDNFYA